MKIVTSFVAMLGASISSLASAQTGAQMAEHVSLATGTTVSTLSTAASAQCELHVWPSAGMRSVYSGWFHGGIVDGAVKGRDGYKPIPADPMEPPTQLSWLNKQNLPTLLNLPDHRLITHDTPLESRAIRGQAGRLTSSTSPCYAEFVIDSVFFQEDVVTGGRIKTLFRYRNFATANAPGQTFGSWTQTPLKIFPPKEAKNNEAALAELEAAYGANIVAFVDAMTKPPKKMRK